MDFKADIGIIGALDDEVREIISRLDGRKTETVGSIEFNTGRLYGKNVVVARCGVGKVFAAICAEAMIIKYSPRLIVNSGVGGALDKSLRPLDIVFADKLVQHDMDTSAIGDPIGLISGINRVYFETDERAREILTETAKEQGINYLVGTVATGDKFISDKADKDRITELFGASACEMEGGAMAQVCYRAGVPFAILRSISDDIGHNTTVDFNEFKIMAAKKTVDVLSEVLR